MEFVSAIQNRDAKELVQILKEQEKQESDEAFFRLVHSSFMSSVSLLHWAAELGSKECAKLLLESKHKDSYGTSDVNKKDDSGATPLHWASGEGNIDCVELFLDKKANVNAVDFGGETPLHWAALNGHKTVIEMLLDKGAAINKQSDNGYTPLHNATINSHASCISSLLNRGADPSIKDKQGKTPKDIAVERKYTQLIDYFNAGKRETLDVINSLESEVLKLRDELKNLKEAHDVQGIQLRNANKERFTNEHNNQELLKTIEDLKKALAQEKEKNVKSQEEMDNLLGEYKELMKQNTMLELENQSLKASLQEKEHFISPVDTSEPTSSVTAPVNTTASIPDGSLLLNVQDRQSVRHNVESIRALLAQTFSALESANSMMDNIEVKFK